MDQSQSVRKRLSAGERRHGYAAGHKVYVEPMSSGKKEFPD